MFRLVVLVLLGLVAFAPAEAADYEINLSALDALGGAQNTESQLPLPVVKPKAVPVPKAKPRPLPTARVKKSVEPVVKRQPQKTVRSLPVAAVKKAEAAKVELTMAQGEKNAEKNNNLSVPTEPNTIPEQAEKIVSSVVSESKSANEKEPEQSEIKTVIKKEKAEVSVSDKGKKENVSENLPSDEMNEKKQLLSYFSDSSAVLVFDADSAELTDEIIQVLTAFADSLDVQNPRKIAIEAYNYDSGEGSFSRKRLSLNRAVAVRSWLLGKGYKSFGIKIINTEDVSLQNNILVSY
uniref:OmpA-like domain-containing protein n=1 Tax=uncultured Alphaproteobacteria bacterium TaxID=91750 RepID=A0A6G8F2A4_9PROT|nr:hypothetical protein PlAlph_2890 [uncultured Alphaproteobacteria bacterium]